MVLQKVSQATKDPT